MSKPTIKARYSKEKQVLFIRMTGKDEAPYEMRISPVPESIGRVVATEITHAARPDLVALAMVIAPLVITGNRPLDCTDIPMMNEFIGRKGRPVQIAGRKFNH